MKKIKLLPLLAAGLLALTGCSTSNEISHKKAQGLYDPDAGISYYKDSENRHCAIYEASPEVIVVKGANDDEKEAKVAQVTARVALTDMYTYLNAFQTWYTVDSSSFNFASLDENFYQLAKFFQEKPTYRLDGKVLTTTFTGSTHKTIETVEYGFAMHLEVKYNKVGLIYDGSYELVVSTDLNKSTAETKLRYLGSIDIGWKLIH